MKKPPFKPFFITSNAKKMHPRIKRRRKTLIFPTKIILLHLSRLLINRRYRNYTLTFFETRIHYNNNKICDSGDKQADPKKN